MPASPAGPTGPDPEMFKNDFSLLPATYVEDRQYQEDLAHPAHQEDRIHLVHPKISC